VAVAIRHFGRGGILTVLRVETELTIVFTELVLVVVAGAVLLVLVVTVGFI
jgi:hypothetical protein